MLSDKHYSVLTNDSRIFLFVTCSVAAGKISLFCMVCANFNHGYLQCVIYCLWRLVLAVYDVLTGKVVRNLEGGHKSCVRDISWHPYQHTIISSSVSVCVRAHHAMGTHENSS